MSGGELPPEFSLIARHFKPLAAPAALGLLDDAALLTPPPGRELVLTADAIVEGVHFLPGDPADLVARKLLRVNLSDLAAKGAEPLGYLLTISVPRNTPDAWFEAFAAGLAHDQQEFGIALLGGDTTSTPGPISLSLTALGTVHPSEMVRRTGARPGDLVAVTGTIGDGTLGLRALQGELPDPDGALAERYRLPRPRLGLVRPALVNAAMDISDGLVQDLGHLCRAAGLGATIETARLPLSKAARAAGPAWLEACLTGGDDYELLLAVSPVQWPTLAAASADLKIAVAQIGTFHAGDGITVLDPAGQSMPLRRHGWSHF